MLINLFSFLIGYLAGFATLAIPLSMWAYKIYKNYSKIAEESKKDFEEKRQKQDKINQRMRKVQSITEMQSEIIAQTQAPSASASHSKHKNELVSKFKNLEEEKVGILESIVKDGYDPVIVVADPATGQQTERKLSDFLSMHKQNSFEPQLQPDAPAGSKKVERRGNLFVVDGGEDEFDKDNSDNGDSGPTYH